MFLEHFILTWFQINNLFLNNIWVILFVEIDDSLKVKFKHFALIGFSRNVLDYLLNVFCCHSLEWLYLFKCEKIVHAYLSDVLQSKTRFHSHAPIFGQNLERK
jgi:hypothetical protein